MSAISTTRADGRELGRRRALPAFRPDTRLLSGGLILAVYIVAAVAARWLAPYDPHSFPAVPLAMPSAAHPLGANDSGQDILSELIYGTRISLGVGFAVALLSTAIAWSVGLLCGLSRATDRLVGALIDLMLVLPPLLVVLLIAAYAGAGLFVVIATLSLTSWAAFARIVRGQAQSEQRRPYIEAAAALGAPPVRIVVRHIAPATLPIAAVKFTLSLQEAVIVQASITFLGLGDPNSVSWGMMLHRAAQSPLLFLSRAWLWWLLPPALAIALLVVGVALIGWSIDDHARQAQQ